MQFKFCYDLKILQVLLNRLDIKYLKNNDSLALNQICGYPEYRQNCMNYMHNFNSFTGSTQVKLPYKFCRLDISLLDIRAAIPMKEEWLLALEILNMPLHLHLKYNISISNKC